MLCKDILKTILVNGKRSFALTWIDYEWVHSALGFLVTDITLRRHFVLAYGSVVDGVWRF